VSVDLPACTAADADAMTSRTRCSCDVGCPCCGHCVQPSSSSLLSWPPLPASSIAALRDVHGFIARYRVSSPPPLIQSPTALSADSTTWLMPASTAELDRSVSASNSGKPVVEDSRELRQPLRDTTAELSNACQSSADSSAPVHSDETKSSVMTRAHQLDAHWAQRPVRVLPTTFGVVADGGHTTAQHPIGKATSRPSAPPPPVPTGSLTPTSVDRSAAEYDELLTQTQTLPRAASTRSLQAPPPRPPPRTTIHDSAIIPTLLGRSLPPEPTQIADTDRMSLCQGQMSTFQGTLKENGAHGSLSGSVQSLPGCDVAARWTTSRTRPAPQPPRRGSSMSPRLQTKSMRYGGRARSASLRCTDDDADDDPLLRLTGRSSSPASATLTSQQPETSAATNQPTTRDRSREPSRQATVSGQKPIAQIRPHAIRSPSASSYTRQRMTDDTDSKCSTEARAYRDRHSPVQTHSTDRAKSLAFVGDGLLTDGQSATHSNASVSRFMTLRSRIKDYVTAAAGVSAGRKQQTSSSSSFVDWTLPRGRGPAGGTRRSSSATSWEPDRSDYASVSGSERSRGMASFDDGAPWQSSSSSYFGAFPGPRPFTSPRTRATEVSLPQNIVASADSATSAVDITSSITSRISTFLTFLGGSRGRPAETSPTSDVPHSQSSTTLQRGHTSAVTDNTGMGRFSNSVSGGKAPAAKAVVDPIVSTLERRSRSVSASPPVRSASTSEVLAKATAVAAAAARDARGRQPLRFVREQRTSMSTFRNSGSLNVTVARSSSFSPHSTIPIANEAGDAFQTSDGRRTSKCGTLDTSSGKVLSSVQSSAKYVPSAASYVHQSAPSTPLDCVAGGEVKQNMTSSLPGDSSAIRPPQMDQSTDSSENPDAGDVNPRTCSSTTVPLLVFRQADVEVERLIELLQNAAAVPVDRPSAQDGGANEARLEAERESLLALTRQFVDDCQRLVSGATRSIDALVVGVEPSLATLTRLTVECRSTASLIGSPSQGVMLVSRVRDLAHAYRSTLSAAQSAVGRPFNGVEMKSLMRQATSLAAILSALIKMLNRTDIIC